MTCERLAISLFTVNDYGFITSRTGQKCDLYLRDSWNRGFDLGCSSAVACEEKKYSDA